MNASAIHHRLTLECSNLHLMKSHDIFFIDCFSLLEQYIEREKKKHFLHKVSDNIQSKKLVHLNKVLQLVNKTCTIAKNTDADVDILQKHLSVLLSELIIKCCGAEVVTFAQDNRNDHD